jgi:cyclin-dependent kinase-like
LLVGESYGKAADVWAVGCILGELVDGQPMFPGEDEMDQIYLIRKCMGEITQNQLGALKRNPKFFGITFPEVKTLDSIESRYLGKIEKKALSFMKLCLTIDPSKRITVDEALKHPYLLPLSMKDNEHTNDETNLLEHGRRIFMRNESKILVNDTREN